MTPLISSWDEQQKLRILARYNAGTHVSDIKAALKCGMKSVYRVLNELEQQGHKVYWRRYDTRRKRESGDIGGAEKA